LIGSKLGALVVVDIGWLPARGKKAYSHSSLLESRKVVKQLFWWWLLAIMPNPTRSPFVKSVVDE
jgi:hypothetical protein